MADDLRDRYAQALTAEHYRRARAQIVVSPEEHSAAMADAVLAVRDEELERLRYERRLLGWARMTLDLVAAGDPSRWEQARREAEDVAQRIVDEIGHPVTDEPALGPGLRAERDALKAARCPSCDHLTSHHQPEGCRYTFAVAAGATTLDLVCACTVPLTALDTPSGEGECFRS